MGKKRGGYRVFMNKPEERESLENLSVDGGKNINVGTNTMGWR
jgi:hypothetical protein